MRRLKKLFRRPREKKNQNGSIYIYIYIIGGTRDDFTQYYNRFVFRVLQLGNYKKKVSAHCKALYHNYRSGFV